MLVGSTRHSHAMSWGIFWGIPGLEPLNQRKMWFTIWPFLSCYNSIYGILNCGIVIILSNLFFQLYLGCFKSCIYMSASFSQLLSLLCFAVFEYIWFEQNLSMIGVYKLVQLIEQGYSFLVGLNLIIFNVTVMLFICSLYSKETSCMIMCLYVTLYKSCISK